MIINDIALNHPDDRRYFLRIPPRKWHPAEAQRRSGLHNQGGGFNRLIDKDLKKCGCAFSPTFYRHRRPKNNWHIAKIGGWVLMFTRIARNTRKQTIEIGDCKIKSVAPLS